LSTRRIDLIIGIGYGDNIAQARDIIIGIMAADERILKDPEAAVSIAELAESSIDLKVRPWVNADDYWSVRPDLLEQIKLQLDAAGITIPYPQQDVHMHEVKSAA
jgi:small conductance mechanosensitive channel